MTGTRYPGLSKSQQVSLTASQQLNSQPEIVRLTNGDSRQISFGSSDGENSEELGIMGATASEWENKHCRECQSLYDVDLIAPCLCGGERRWVHRKCLNRIRVDTRNPRNFSYCSECHFCYKMVLQRPPSEDEMLLKDRRRALIRKIVKHSVLSFIIVQIWLLLMTFAIQQMKAEDKIFAAMGGQKQAPTNAYHMTFFRYVVALVGTIMFVLLAALAYWVSGLCRKVRRLLGAEEEGGEGDDDHENLLDGGRCDECLFHSRRLWQDWPRCDFHWLHNIYHSCTHACWPSENVGGGGEGGGAGDAIGGDGHGGGHDADMDFDGSEAIAWIVFGFLLFLAFIALVGIIVLGVIFVLWLQKVIVKWFQLAELKSLSKEYVVEDLASRRKPLNEEEVGHHMPDDIEKGKDLVEPIKNGRTPSPMTNDRDTINASLEQDLKYLYGYVVTPPAATRQLSKVSKQVTFSMRTLSTTMGVRPMGDRIQRTQSQGNSLAFTRMNSGIPIRQMRSH